MDFPKFAFAVGQVTGALRLDSIKEELKELGVSEEDIKNAEEALLVIANAFYIV